jgi:hypothetical protein
MPSEIPLNSIFLRWFAVFFKVAIQNRVISITVFCFRIIQLNKGLWKESAIAFADMFYKVWWSHTFGKKYNTRSRLLADLCDLTSGDQRDTCCYSFRPITVSQACGSDHLAMCLQKLRKIPKMPVTATRTGNFVRRREYSKPHHVLTVRHFRQIFCRQ